MLRVGHKYALRNPLRKSLFGLIQEVEQKYGQTISKLSDKEAANWKKWKLNLLRETVRLDEPPKYLDKILKEGMDEIRQMQVVVKQADKNLGLVPIRGDIYRAMVKKWISPPSFEKVRVFPHEDIQSRVENTIRYSRAVPQQLKEQWTAHMNKAKDPCPFYAIPKIHKNTPLGSRPISAQHSYILAPLSRELANVLLQVQYSCKGITRDTISFVNRVEEFKASQPFVFMTYDVEACYPSIDINDAIDTLYHNIPVMQQNGAFWTKILQLIMYNNYVSANGLLYRQMIGTATGTQVAPPFANLYLYFKFKQTLQDQSILLQERFIDDGFLLVSTREDAVRIIGILNGLTNLKLTYEIDNHQAIFLDLVIHKGIRFDTEHRLDLKTYFKPTNRLLYLPMASNHPMSMKAGIVKGEAIRTLRNSTNKADWLKALSFIFKGLMARGYPPNLIKRAWKKVRWEDREYYLKCRSGSQKPKGTLVFTTFNPATRSKWNDIIKKFPFENIFPKRLFKWNKRQLTIMKRWPPTIIWSQFSKVGNYMISSKQCWHYPKLKRKSQQPLETNNPAKRLRRN